MRLKRIKLAGFKSFVDPTTISLPSNLIGIVGPNGCGKSNIIDAVRWVLGEGSPKNLRGDHMADVIFSGSASRKPLGRAAVELVFDNADGTVPGPYGQYAELSVRREISRDGQSDYFLNRTKCRRKDITSCFHGTGLGPRAYSVIEQGMVTRIIEGKPEDLRAFVEEVAGVSRYKDRRRETETRMRRTRENLERVEDLRQELATQLSRLKRQSRAAERYREYKKNERLLDAQLAALRWRALKKQSDASDGQISRLDVDLEAKRADQRQIEAETEALLQERTAQADRFNQVQGDFYKLGAEIATAEQALAHDREARRKRQAEAGQLKAALKTAAQSLTGSRQRRVALAAELQACGPRLEHCGRLWEQARGALDAAQGASARARGREVQQARAVELTRILEQLTARRSELVEESARLAAALKEGTLGRIQGTVAGFERQYQDGEQRLEQLDGRLAEARRQLAEQVQSLEPVAAEFERVQARLVSLRELAQGHPGGGDGRDRWLKARKLDQAPRLSEVLRVSPGWEPAVERVLGDVLGALCVESVAVAGERSADGVPGALALVETATGFAAGPEHTLADKVRCDSVDVGALLAGVHIAPDLPAALARRTTLAPGEVVVTPQGTLAGRNWLDLGGADKNTGVLTRLREIDTLTEQVSALDAQVTASREGIARGRETVESLREQRDEARAALRAVVPERGVAQGELAREQARIDQLRSRHGQVATELDELAQQLAREEDELAQARRQMAAAPDEVTGEDGADLNEKLEVARRQESEARDARHREELAQQRLEHELASADEAVDREQRAIGESQARLNTLRGALAEGDDPDAAVQGQLDALLQRRVAADTQVNDARQALEAVDGELKVREQRRRETAGAMEELREQIEALRMTQRELSVRSDTIVEQVSERGLNLETVVAELSPDANEAVCGEQLEDLQRKISRIGPVNLVAIEEFEEQSERKGYLDRQYEDLSTALATLESAIRKIDRETRTRFKETFDRVNKGFQDFFPRLFGGGHAYLEMTSDDLLASGITVMARPPGKRNSTIHLLSGGEKALSAVALIFAFFNLNPAPFCVLDEVDAPLDDTNIARFCDTLRTLAARSQMMFISHNKLTMEAADALIGVTMVEPGVSRLVAVDVVQAVEMAAS